MQKEGLYNAYCSFILNPIAHLFLRGEGGLLYIKALLIFDFL